MFNHNKPVKPIGKIVSWELVDGELIIQGTIFAKEENLMEELLKALQQKDQRKVYEIGSKLLVTKDNSINGPQANEFEKYAPCKITEAKSDVFHFRSFVGIIEYNDQVYYFG